MITSGRWRRTAAARSRRNSIPLLTRPSGWSRNSTTETPTAAAAATCSAVRSGPARLGAMESMPASPRVAQHVADVLANGAPAGYGRRRAVFEVVGMSHHRQSPAPILRQPGQSGTGLIMALLAGWVGVAHGLKLTAPAPRLGRLAGGSHHGWGVKLHPPQAGVVHRQRVVAAVPDHDRACRPSFAPCGPQTQ